MVKSWRLIRQARQQGGSGPSPSQPGQTGHEGEAGIGIGIFIADAPEHDTGPVDVSR